MKFITSIIGTLAIFGAAVMAQDPSTLPACGQTCISNLLGQAGNFGCTGGSADEAHCLCSNATFTYGIRDCSNESCGDSAAAASVIAYGIQYCSSAGVAIPTTIVSVTSGTIVPSVTGSGAGGASAITTSSFTSTETSGGSTLTTTGATTIFGGGAAGSATGSAGSAASSASASGSKALSSASGSISSAVGSATSAAGSAASSAAGSETSSAFAPHMTAAPVGLLAAAAGVAAMLL